jgi:orotidine-5'-phosphate decarboxylase
MLSSRERLIVALDVSTAAEAQEIVTSIGDAVTFYKVGMQLYTAEGPDLVRDLISSGRRVFLDLKYHDIPNTVASAVLQAGKLKVSLLTVHASGGTKMLRAAADAARDINPALKVVAVTVLTSMAQLDLDGIGVQRTVLQQVIGLASMALSAGCAGVVSSVQEVRTLREKLGNEFTAITPGIRPAGAARGDQARVATPAEAIAAGASHIVVGRPITAAASPALEAEKILQEIS